MNSSLVSRKKQYSKRNLGGGVVVVGGDEEDLGSSQQLLHFPPIHQHHNDDNTQTTGNNSNNNVIASIDLDENDDNDKHHHHHYHSSSTSTHTNNTSIPQSSIRWMSKCIKIIQQTNNNNHYKSKKASKLENNIIIGVSIWFVSIGFVVTYLLFHPRHRTVIGHIMNDPWHHVVSRVVVGMYHNNNHNSQLSNSKLVQFPHNGGGIFHHHYYTGTPQYVTVVLPSIVNVQHRLQRLEAIHATWGPFARSIFVVHNVQNEFPHGQHLTIDTIKLIKPIDPYSYPQTLLLPASIGHTDGIRRLYYTIRTIYDEINPEYAFFVNDHTFVIPEHLCVYIDIISKEQIATNQSRYVYDGHALRTPDNEMFNSGAAGYILSRSTMKLLIDKWDAKDPNCWIPDLMDDNTGTSNNDNNHNNNNEKGSEHNRKMINSIDKLDETTNNHALPVEKKQKQDYSWLQGNPGLLTVRCLLSMNITVIDTRQEEQQQQQDQLNTIIKSHRFHAFPLLRMIEGEHGVDEWYVKKHQNIPERYISIFDESYTSSLLYGSQCCSNDTISFHYVEASECRALYTIRQSMVQQQSTNKKIMSNEQIRELIIQHWPKSTIHEIGHYSKGLPPVTNNKNNNMKNQTDIEIHKQTWSNLIETLRKISQPELQMEC